MTATRREVILDAILMPDATREGAAVRNAGRKALDDLLAREQNLIDGIHAAVSFTYIDGEAARLKARVALKQAAGWPLADGEEARLAELVVTDVP